MAVHPASLGQFIESDLSAAMRDMAIAQVVLVLAFARDRACDLSCRAAGGSTPCIPPFCSLPACARSRALRQMTVTYVNAPALSRISEMPPGRGGGAATGAQ